MFIPFGLCALKWATKNNVEKNPGYSCDLVASDARCSGVDVVVIDVPRYVFFLLASCFMLYRSEVREVSSLERLFPTI